MLKLLLFVILALQATDDAVAASKPKDAFYSFPSVRFRAVAGADLKLTVGPFIDYINRQRKPPINLKTFKTGRDFVETAIKQPALFAWMHPHLALYLSQHHNYQPVLVNVINNQTLILRRKQTAPVVTELRANVAIHDQFSLPAMIAKRHFSKHTDLRHYSYQDVAMLDLLAGKVKYAVVTRWANKLLAADMGEKLQAEAIGPAYNGYVFLLHRQAEDFKTLLKLSQNYATSKDGQRAISLMALDGIRNISLAQLQQWQYLQDDIEQLLTQPP